MGSPALRPVFKLFVSGAAEYSGLKLELLTQELNALCGGNSVLERIDVRDDPRQVRDYSVVVTPILIRVSPWPQRRIFGDLQGRLGLLAPTPLEPSGSGEPVSSTASVPQSQAGGGQNE